jgi:hypothetical protein
MDKDYILGFLGDFAHTLDTKNMNVEADAITGIMVRVAQSNLTDQLGLVAPNYSTAFNIPYDTGAGISMIGQMPGISKYNNGPDYGPVKKQKQMEGMTPQEVALRNEAIMQNSGLLNQARQEQIARMKYTLNAFTNELNALDDNKLRIKFFQHLTSDKGKPISLAVAAREARTLSRQQMMAILLADQKAILTGGLNVENVTPDHYSENLNDQINSLGTTAPNDILPM